MTYEPKYEHRFTYIVSFHMYICQVEYRCNTEADAYVKLKEYEQAFKTLLGDAYNQHIKKFDLTMKAVQFSPLTKNHKTRTLGDKVGRPATREFEDGMKENNIGVIQ